MAENQSRPADASDANAALRFRRFGAAMAMRLERVWPLLVPLLIVVAAFLALAWFGAFRAVGDIARFAIVALLGIGALAASSLLLRYREPTSDEIDRRLERENTLDHQPLSAQSDTLPDDADPFARAMWDEHRRRMRERLVRLGGASPRADMPRRDPWALRALAPLILLVAFAFSFGGAGGRVADAFSPPRASAETIAARMDAWVTPPDYTGVAPIFLSKEGDDTSARTVPEGSVFTVRISEGGDESIVEALGADGRVTRLEPDGGGDAASGSAAYATELRESGSVRVAVAGGTREFAFDITPDNEPTIAWRENEDGAAHEVSQNGALTLHYRAGDDYGLRGGTARFDPVAMDDARPLYEPLELPLAMPRQNARSDAARTSRDLTEHPFAGAVVDVTLEATDAVEQTARSAARRMELPERDFRNPLALAILEQRRALAMNANEVPRVLGNLDLLMLHAETTIDDTAQFLGLSSARGRVANAFNDDMLRDAVDAMWELARGIEDGAVSSAERRLRDAQDALAEALENGASDEELSALMDELREAMQEFMQAMAERMQQSPQQAMPMMPNAQVMTQDDIERMLDNMEEMARSGDRESAQAMLDQLRQMMDQLQAGTPQQGQQQQMGEMQQQMQEMGDLLREQQQLMDETFRMEGSRPPPGLPQPGDEQSGMQPPQSSPGEQRRAQRPNSERGGEQRQGQQPEAGQLPQPGEPMTPEQFAEAMEQLREQQEALQRRLDEMQEAMEGMGLQPGEQFGEAGEAMGDAEGDLGEGQSGRAVDDQGRAIEALRQGAQNMMQQMMQAMQQGQGQGQGMQPGMGMMPMQPGQGQQGQGRADPFGQGFGQSRADRDPLGRPRATQGPQFGDEIEVPDEIDTQTARRILEAIRERLGEQLTPKLEREYLERLLDLR